MPAVVAARSWLVWLALAVVGTAVCAQTVYRCGPSGNRYSEQPCDDGRRIDVSDRRSAEQLADAREGVRARQRLAAAMARERSASERAVRPAGAGSIGPVPAAAPRTAGSAAGSRPKRMLPAGSAVAADPAPHFTAVVPGSGRAAKKAKPDSKPRR